MSGVYIKGMEMPTSCADCRFCNGQANTDYGVCAWCNVDGKARDAYTRQDCPLVPVPPHGRLIDADALDTSILQAGFSYALTRRKLRYTPGDVRQKIANAPTIIPASCENPAKSRDNHEIGEAEGASDVRNG